MPTSQPKIVPGPVDAELPFGTPVTRTESVGYPETSTAAIQGEVTRDAIQWQGFSIYQSQVDGGLLVGITCSWHARTGSSYTSPTMSGLAELYSPVAGRILIPAASRSVTLAHITHLNNTLCGFQVTYTAPNKQQYVQVAVIDGVSDEYVVSSTPHRIEDTEVLIGIDTVYTNATGICGLLLQIARLPFVHEYGNSLVRPVEIVGARVKKIDNLAIQSIDNTNGEFPITCAISFSHSYMKSFTWTDETMMGYTATVAAGVEFSFSVGIIDVDDAELRLSVQVSGAVSLTKGTANSIDQSEIDTYNQTCNVTVPAKGKTELSLAAFVFEDPHQVSTSAWTTVTYSWYRYEDGGVYTSPPIEVKIQISKIDQPVYFSIIQNIAS